MKKWIGQKNSNVSSIQRFTHVQNNIEDTDSLKEQLISIDQKISNITKELFMAQAVKIKSALSQNNGWLQGIKQKWYQSATNESIIWHKDRLRILHKERREIQIKLEKKMGRFWLNQIRRWLALLALLISSLIVIWIIFMGLFTAIYLLPIWGSVLIAYWVIKKKGFNLS